MSRVINRKNIIVTSVLTGDRQFSRFISLPFQADTMIVKLITCLGATEFKGDGNPERIGDVRLIWCENVNDCIGSFFDDSTSSPNITFDVSNCAFNTEWKFASKLVDGAFDASSIGTLVIHLEFTQHQ